MSRFHLPILTLIFLLNVAPAGAQSADAARAALCARLDGRLASWKAELERIIPGQKREVAAWYSTHVVRKSEESWLKNALSWPFRSYEIIPPRVGAEYSKNVGELSCLNRVLGGCDGHREGPVFDPDRMQDVAAFNAMSITLADQIEASANQDWAMSLERKHMVSNTSEASGKLRWLAEANVLSGSTTACRIVVEYLRGGLLPEAEAEPELKRGKPLTSKGNCSELMREIPDFCSTPPGDGDEDLYDECCEY